MHNMTKTYCLENDRFIIKVGSKGATLLSFFDKKLNNDLVLGYDDLDYYTADTGYLGSMVGRCANRIANGRFTLNNQEYNVLVNNGPNSLHGGSVPFSFVEFDLIKESDDELVFEYFSKDNEAGYPGNLTLTVSYCLDNKGLHLKFDGISDKDTLFNITNHSYFNLSGGKDDSLNTLIKIPTKYVQIGDDNTLGLEEIRDVKNTSFDFLDFKSLKKAILENDDNLSAGGIDHNFVFETLEDKTLCILKNERVKLEIRSDLPGIQVYTSNWFDHFKGRDGIIYDKYWGIALEPQFAPNAINYQCFIKPILKANHKVSHHIDYLVEELWTIKS